MIKKKWGQAKMTIFNIFRRIKTRKYPIIRDETGKSARQRCFEMFEDQVSFKEIAAATGSKIDTVYRYHRQWSKNPGIETRIKYFKKQLRPLAPDRERQIELFAQVLGISKEQFESILHQPHGLRRLFSGKIYFPKQAEADHKCYLAMEIANLISDHLLKNGGKLEDIKYAFEHWMKENLINREEDDEDIKEENNNIAFTRKLIEADVENEKRGRVKPDRLSDEERNVILKWGQQSAAKKLERTYWLRIAELMVEGKTVEQGREKIYQDLLEKGDIEGAKSMRRYQNIIHPLKNNNPNPAPILKPLPTP
jgi:hypothetical protein